MKNSLWSMNVKQSVIALAIFMIITAIVIGVAVSKNERHNDADPDTPAESPEADGTPEEDPTAVEIAMPPIPAEPSPPAAQAETEEDTTDADTPDTEDSTTDEVLASENADDQAIVEPILICLIPTGENNEDVIYRLDDSPVDLSPEELGPALQARIDEVGGDLGTPIMIRPNGEVLWKHVVHVFNTASGLRMENVGFAPSR